MLTHKWPYPLVEIVWDDSATATGWESEHEIEVTEELATTIGFLIKKTRTHYILGSSVYYCKAHDEYQFNDRLQVPRGMVKHFNVLVPKNVSKDPEPNQSTA